MKKTIIILGCALLAACTSTPPQQVNFQPLAAETVMQTETKSFVLTTKDIRTAQYVALIDYGEEQVQPIHPDENVREAIHDALFIQLTSSGYEIASNSENTIELEIQHILVKASKGSFKGEAKGRVEFKLTAETPNGKFVKTYSGVGSKSGAAASSVEEIEEILNNTTNIVLKEIAKDQELTMYIKDNF
jgi:uncharacterized lipoprotein